MATLFVEILTRRGQVAGRTRIERFPATVGRSYSSDVIVDDTFVSANHLSLEEQEDGTIRLVDTSDANGVIDTHSGHRIDSLTLDREALLQIGSTLLRVRSDDFGNEPPRPYPGGAKVTARGWRQPAVTLLVLMATLGILRWSEFLATTSVSTVARHLEEMVGFVVVLLAWTGCWAFASSALAHESFFGRHLRIACVGSVVMTVWDAVVSYGAFFVTLDTHPTITQTLGYAMIFAIFLYRHLSLVSRQSRRRRKLIAAGLGLLIVAGGVISQVASSDNFTWYPEHSALLKPIPPRFLSAETPDALFESAAELRDRVDELAAADDD